MTPQRLVISRIGANYYGEWDCLTAWVVLPLTIEWEFFEESKKMLGSYANLILETFQDVQKEMPEKFFIVIK